MEASSGFEVRERGTIGAEPKRIDGAGRSISILCFSIFFFLQGRDRGELRMEADGFLFPASWWVAADSDGERYTRNE